MTCIQCGDLLLPDDGRKTGLCADCAAEVAGLEAEGGGDISESEGPPQGEDEE